MAEITYNDLLGQLSGMEKDQFEGIGFGSKGFLENYQNNPNAVSVTGHDNFNKFEPIAKAYQASETIPKGNFVSNMFNFGSADAAMPDQTYGLQDSMMGMSINPDGSLNYNNTQPQNLGFRSMVDMANDANNFDSQFSYPASQPQNLGFIESAPQPKEAIYQDRIMNRNLSNSNYEPRQGILQGLQDKIGAGFNNVKDFAIDKGRMGKNLIGAGAAKFAGLPGMVGSGLMSLLSNLGDGADYQQYTPGFDYNGLNDSMINDFYDPATGLNRFDRARRKGNTFASSRTLAEYFQKRKEKKAQDKINAAAATKAAEAAARGNYTPGGSHLSRGTSGGGLGLSQAQAQSVSQANKDAGYSSFSGLKDGGLASMFTRRR